MSAVICCEGLAAYRAGSSFALSHSADCKATEDRPYEDAEPGSLRERLRDLLYPVPQGEWLAENVERVVATWLRDKGDRYGGSAKITLRNLAMYAEDGQA